MSIDNINKLVRNSINDIVFKCVTDRVEPHNVESVTERLTKYIESNINEHNNDEVVNVPTDFYNYIFRLREGIRGPVVGYIDMHEVR